MWGSASQRKRAVRNTPGCSTTTSLTSGFSAPGALISALTRPGRKVSISRAAMRRPLMFASSMSAT